MQEDYGKLYTELHARKDGKYFPGRGRGPEADAAILQLVQSYDAYRVLDYGSGKGKQYTGDKPLHQRWGLGIAPVCYDVGVPELARRPDGKFDGVICTDMMEHIAESDVDEVLKDIFSFVEDFGFAFFHISTRPSGNRGKNLSDGRDPHLTVKPAEWWRAKLKAFERDRLTIVAQFGD
jgi:hypothetical protein